MKGTCVPWEPHQRGFEKNSLFHGPECSAAWTLLSRTVLLIKSRAQGQPRMGADQGMWNEGAFLQGEDQSEEQTRNSQ